MLTELFQSWSKKAAFYSWRSLTIVFPSLLIVILGKCQRVLTLLTYVRFQLLVTSTIPASWVLKRSNQQSFTWRDRLKTKLAIFCARNQAVWKVTKTNNNNVRSWFPNSNFPETTSFNCSIDFSINSSAFEGTCSMGKNAFRFSRWKTTVQEDQESLIQWWLFLYVYGSALNKVGCQKSNKYHESSKKIVFFSILDAEKTRIWNFEKICGSFFGKLLKCIFL